MIVRTIQRKRYSVGRPHVLFQFVWSEEAFVAEPACVAVVTSVDSHVVVQVIPAGVTLVTLFTLKRLIFGVCEQVSLELVIAVERLHAPSVTAEGAGEGRSGVRVVNERVPLHFVPASKRFSALRTLVFLLRGMYCSRVRAKIC